MFCALTWKTALNEHILELVARVVEWCEPPRNGGRGHPPAETVRVLATLRRFLREGTPWRSLRATNAQASGSTLWRHFAGWAWTGALRRAHSMLVGILRGQPDLACDLIVNSCSVRAKRGGELTGPNPTDRAEKGTKYRVAVNGCGLLVACMATAANVNYALMFERLFRLAHAVMTRVRTAFADKSTTPKATATCAVSTAPNRASTSAASRTAPAWASAAGPSSAPTPGCWRTSASACAMTGSATPSKHCSRPRASSWLYPDSPENSENCLLA